MKRKPKIRLCSVENNCFDDIKVISEEAFESIQKDIETINSYKNHFLVFVYFQLNFLEFDKLCKRLSDISITRIDINKVNNSQDFINTNRVIFNLLASFRFFIDNSESHIKRHFGKKGKEAKDFKTLTSSFYDKYFSYRFLYKLRNFSQHLGFPIKMMPFKAIENNINPEKMIGSFALIVSRENLLEEKDLLNSKLKDDLNGMTEDIDVIPLIKQLGKMIQKIEKFIYSLHQEKLEDSIENLKLFAGKYKTDNNEISIISNLLKDENKLTIETLTLPFNEIAEIENFKNWK